MTTKSITKGIIGEEDLNRWDGLTSTFTRTISTGSKLTLNKIGYEVDVLMIYGGQVNYTSATIQSAIDAVGSTNKVTLTIRPGTWTISSALTFTSNINLKIVCGAVLTHAAGGSLAINGPLEAGFYQIFSDFAAGEVTFAVGIKANPLWWGAFNDKTNAHATYHAIQAAISSSSQVYISEGSYAIDTDLDCTVRGNAGGAVLSIEGAPGYMTSTIWWEGAATGIIMDWTKSRFGRIKNLGIKNAIGYPAYVALLCARGTVGGDNSDDFYLEDVHIWGYFSKANIYSVTSEGAFYLNCTFANYHNSGYTLARVKTNVLSVTSPYGTIVAYNGNTIGWMHGCHVYHYGTGTPMLLNGTEGFGIHSSFIYSYGGVSGIELTGNTHNLDIQNVNYESGGIHFIYFSDATSVNMNIRLSNIINISESTSLANAAIYAVDSVSITGFTVDNILGYISGGGTWYLMSVYSLYGATIETAGYTYEIRGADYGNLIKEDQTTTSPILRYSGSFRSTLTSTSNSLTAIANAINTVGKYEGKAVWNTTTKRFVYATGAAAADVWNDAVGALAHTPV